MWTIIVILVLVLIILTKISGLFGSSEPISLDASGLSSVDYQLMLRFRNQITSTANIGEFMYWVNPAQSYVNAANRIIEILDKVSDKKQFAKTYSKQYGESVSASIIAKFGDVIYNDIACAISNYSEFM